MRVKAVFCLLATFFCLAAPAAADDQDEAKKSFMKGLDLFEAQDYRAAVEAFRLANELNPSWKILFNIGQCEAALKRYGLAIEAFERYLAEGGDEIPSDRRDETIGELKRLREMVGLIMIKGPDRLEVYVDDVLRGTTPIPSGLLVSAGIPHEFRITNGGMTVYHTEATLRGGLELELDVTSEQDPPVEPDPPPRDPSEENRGLSPVGFWIGAGATVAFGVTAIALDAAIGKKIDGLREDPSDGDLRDSARSMQVANYVIIGLAGAALVTTGVLAFMTDFKGEDDDTDIALAPWVTAEGGGLGLEGRF